MVKKKNNIVIPKSLTPKEVALRKGKAGGEPKPTER